MKVIYIAGPFRGRTPWDVEQNVRRAEALSLEVWRAGYAAICPHTNTRFFDGACGIMDQVWLDGDLEILRRCDAVLLTDGWQTSAGAVSESLQANDWGIPVFETLAELVEQCPR